ncbi:MAG: hypothetical protein WBN15_06630 [Polyangiales bacterium]
MRYLLGFTFVLALGGMGLVGCSEPNEVTDLCEGVICEDDGNECTEDVCSPSDGTCGAPFEDGTACSSGACLGGACTGLVSATGYVTVIDGAGETRPLSGAMVSVHGTSLSTTSDVSGAFILDVFEGDWFFQASNEGAWGIIEIDTVRPTGETDLQLELFSDEVMAELTELLTVDIDDTRGWVQLGFGSDPARGGETATLSEPYEFAFVEDAAGNLVLSDKLLPGGGPDLGFLNVGVTDELVVTPSGDSCVLTHPGSAYPVKAKFRTKLSAWCTPP